MPFAVGDQVVHRAHGLGRVIRLDHVQTQSGTRECYVVDMGRGFIVWVPIDGLSEQCLRPPLDTAAMGALSDVLRSPAQPLQTSSRQRVLELKERMKAGSPQELCALVRDLTSYVSHCVPSANDSAVLLKARGILLAEWALAKGAPDAVAEVNALLQESGGRDQKQAAA